jgi:hypothetical protein
MACFKKKLHLRRTIFPIFAHKNQFAGKMTQVIRKSISKMFLGIFSLSKTARNLAFWRFSGA